MSFRVRISQPSLWCIKNETLTQWNFWHPLYIKLHLPITSITSLLLNILTLSPTSHLSLFLNTQKKAPEYFKLLKLFCKILPPSLPSSHSWRSKKTAELLLVSPLFYPSISSPPPPLPLWRADDKAVRLCLTRDWGPNVLTRNFTFLFPPEVF